MLEAGLYHLLSTTAAIEALCQTRIYPDDLPKDAELPAVTYSIIGGNQNPTLTTRGMQRRRVEFLCIAPLATQAIALREAIRSTLNGYQGVLSDGTNLQNCDFINEAGVFDHEALEYRRMIEFYLYFT